MCVEWGYGVKEVLSPKQWALLYAVQIAVTEVWCEQQCLFVRLQTSSSALHARLGCSGMTFEPIRSNRNKRCHCMSVTQGEKG